MGDISDNFNRSEFLCKCGVCGFDTVDALLLESLEAIRSHFGQPIQVSSGCRCPNYNKTVGGSQNSQHKKGRASDVQVQGTVPSDVADYAEALGLSVGRYSNFTHVDTRSGPPARWGNN